MLQLSSLPTLSPRAPPPGKLITSQGARHLGPAEKFQPHKPWPVRRNLPQAPHRENEEASQSSHLGIDLNLRGENAKKNGPKIKKLLQILFLEEVECHS